MLYFIIIILLITLAAVSARLFIERREIRKLSKKISQIHGKRTNERLTVDTRQKDILNLANAINMLYDDVYAERARGAKTIEEMRRGMSGISHDLRTPLTSILGYLKLLEEGENTPEQTERYISVSYNKAQRLNRLVTGLFELARLESGTHSFDWESINLEEVLSEELAGVYDDLMPSEGEAPPEIDIQGEGLFIRGDRDALSRIFANLLQNIVKHGSSGVIVKSSAVNNTAVVSFSNRAENLSKEDASRLFQRYYTADPTRSREDTGLGLSISKELTEQMDGSITSELQDGILTFTLSWPLLGGSVSNL